MAARPSFTSVTRSGTTINIFWQSVFLATGYDLDRSVNGGAFSRRLFNTTGGSLSDTNLTPGNSYRYRVRSREVRPGQSTILSSYSLSSTISIPIPSPGIPSFLSAQNTGLNSTFVEWGAGTNASTYRLETRESTNGGVSYGAWSTIFTSTTSRSTTRSGLNRGSTYQYRVRSQNSSGSSSYQTVTAFTFVPFRPGSVSASLSGATSISVTFPASNGATGYDIDRRENNGGYSRVTNNTSSRTINYGGLNRGSTYQFQVWARNGGGQSPDARESNSIQVPFPPPSTPPSATATKTKRDVRITFGLSSAPSGTTILNYEIEIRADGGSYGSRRTDNGGGETYSNLNPGSTYQGRVRAIGQGGASGWRESNTVTISPPPTVPSNILRTRSGRDVFVELGTSTAASDVTISGYTIQRRESSNNGATWATWGDQRSFTTTDRTTTYTELTPESTQQFRGRAESDFNSSDWRTSAPLFIPDIPDAPSQVFALREGAAVFVIVAAPVRTGGVPILTYTIQKRISEDFGQTWSEWGEPLIIPFSDSFYRYENLELQKTYQVRALATNSEGNSETFTQSNTVYLPAIMKIYDNGQFRLPSNYRRYSEDVGDWIGLSISKRYLNGQWIDLE